MRTTVIILFAAQLAIHAGAAAQPSLSDDEIRTAMSRGTLSANRTESPPWTPFKSPANFTRLSPGLATRVFLQENRSAAHKKTYELRVDPADPNLLPSTGVILVDGRFGGCTQASGRKGLLICEAERAWFGWQKVYIGRTENDTPRYSVGLRPIDLKTAQWFLHVAWWLNRVSLTERQKFAPDGLPDFDERIGDVIYLFDSASMHLNIQFDMNTVYKGNLSTFVYKPQEIWRATYNRKVMGAFVHELITHLLPEYLGLFQNKSLTAPAHPEYIEALLRHAIAKPGEIPMDWVSYAALSVLETPFDHLTSLVEQLETRHPKPIIEPKKLAEAKAAHAKKKLQEEDRIINPAGRIPLPPRPRGLDLPFDPLSLLTSEQRAIDRFHEKLSESRTKHQYAHNVGVLVQLAQKEDTAFWALKRLRELDQSSYEKALEAAFFQGTQHYMAIRYSLKEDNNTDFAQRIASQIPADEAHETLVKSLMLFRPGQPIPDEGTRIRSALKYIESNSTRTTIDKRVLDFLVPESNPRRFPYEEIDATLLQLTQKPGGEFDAPIPKNDVWQCLLRRNPDRHGDQVLDYLEQTDLFDHSTLMNDLVLHYHRVSRPALKARFHEIIEQNFTTTYGGLNGFLFSCWLADLREFEKQIEQLATQTPEEPESAISGRSSSERMTVTGPLHIARQIMILWQEENPYNKARQLITLSQLGTTTYSFGKNTPYGLRVEKAFREAIHQCNEAQREKVRSFIMASETNLYKHHDKLFLSWLK